MSLPLFSSGTARGGTGLLTQMLSMHTDVKLALDAYLQIFRSLRNAILREHGDEGMRRACPPDSPFSDYYFTTERIRCLDAILAGDLHLPFVQGERQSILEALTQRTVLDSADLVPYLGELGGRTYTELFQNALGIVRKSRERGEPEREKPRWVGFHENWVIELLAPLARTFPDAHFLIILRDPRAVISSHLLTKDPRLRAHVLSYGKHLRKYAAISLHFQTLPLFAGRLHVLRYEDLVTEPERCAQELCRFLGVEYQPAMVETERYVNPGTGGLWTGYSSYEAVALGFKPHRIHRWRNNLSQEAIKTIEFLCAPEMQLFGYQPVSEATDGQTDADVLDYVLRDNEGDKNWRTDFGVPEQDLGGELFRKLLLASPRRDLDRALIRRSFLFEEVFDRVRQKRPGPVMAEVSAPVVRDG